LKKKAMRMKRNKKEEGKQNGEEGIEIEEKTKKGWKNRWK